jgi:hypothetical protein
MDVMKDLAKWVEEGFADRGNRVDVVVEAVEGFGRF